MSLLDQVIASATNSACQTRYLLLQESASTKTLFDFILVSHPERFALYLVLVTKSSARKKYSIRINSFDESDDFFFQL